MPSPAWRAASSRAAFCCWANSLERPPGFPETPGSQLGLSALPIFVPQFALKLSPPRGSLADCVCLRAPDSCTLVEDGVAIAALYRTLARHLYVNRWRNADLDAVAR